MFDKTSLHHDVDVDDDDDDVDDSERRGIQRRPNLEGLSFEHTWTPVPSFFLKNFSPMRCNHLTIFSVLIRFYFPSRQHLIELRMASQASKKFKANLWLYQLLRWQVRLLLDVRMAVAWFFQTREVEITSYFAKSLSRCCLVSWEAVSMCCWVFWEALSSSPLRSDLSWLKVFSTVVSRCSVAPRNFRKSSPRKSRSISWNQQPLGRDSAILN